MDLAEPEWAGTVSFSPTGADFQAIVAAVLDLEGEDATRAWLDGLKANGTVYDGNNVVLESVNSGESAIGIDLPLLLVPRPGRVRRRTATTASCTSSATRTRARSSASPAPAC